MPASAVLSVFISCWVKYLFWVAFAINSSRLMPLLLRVRGSLVFVESFAQADSILCLRFCFSQPAAHPVLPQYSHPVVPGCTSRVLSYRAAARACFDCDNNHSRSFCCR